MQSIPRRGRSKKGHYVCAQHDDASNAGETGDRTSSQSKSPSVSLRTSRKAPIRSESVVWGSQAMGPLVSLPTSRKAERRHICVDDDDASNANKNADRTSSRSRDLSVTNISTISTIGSQDSGNSWEVMLARAGNKITVVRSPQFYVRAVTDMSPRPTPAALPAVVVGRTPWYIWFTKASITLTVLSAAAMVGQDLVQIFAILTMFLGFLFAMGSI